MSSDDTTRVIRPKVAGALRGNSDTTVILEAPVSRGNQGGDTDTKIFRPRSSQSGKPDFVSQDFYKDPLVGWLVIVSGPGKGISLELGYGVNSIGRDNDQRVPLDFGDNEISRKSHAAVIFDQKSRCFFVQHVDGINLTYVNDVPVLQPVEIKGKEVISIGNTKLVFVPLCDADFDWLDRK